MSIRLLSYGMAAWAIGTLALRVAGQRILRPGDFFTTLLVFAISFPAVAWLVRRLCSRARLPREQWPSGAVAILLPTLCLDPFSSVFFSVVFPNIAPEMAGVFGGWMLWCCAGGLLGAVLGRAGTK
jgi:hypothetical protein